jgi:hypothetical protein
VIFQKLSLHSTGRSVPVIAQIILVGAIIKLTWSRGKNLPKAFIAHWMISVIYKNGELEIIVVPRKFACKSRSLKEVWSKAERVGATWFDRLESNMVIP